MREEQHGERTLSGLLAATEAGRPSGSDLTISQSLPRASQQGTYRVDRGHSSTSTSTLGTSVFCVGMELGWALELGQQCRQNRLSRGLSIWGPREWQEKPGSQTWGSLTPWLQGPSSQLKSRHVRPRNHSRKAYWTSSSGKGRLPCGGHEAPQDSCLAGWTVAGRSVAGTCPERQGAAVEVMTGNSEGGDLIQEECGQ